MVLLTVIGKSLAKDGLVFTYMGPLSNCKECKVKNICFHLERGRKYRVLSSRDVLHDCTVHEKGVVVVEVEEVPLEAAIPKKQAIEGSSITIELPRCRERGCDHYRLCIPVGSDSGQKKKVLKVGKKVKCKIGEDRVCVELG
ncbi:MAG: hypothetical protein AYK23_02075 [Candidatus Proteinoplasmatales archaeon SG8-5]|nr:MAG: hypothetical protein AYK23_02075 [Candidatus Proteinoplasmatales archaeon SG8-5]